MTEEPLMPEGTERVDLGMICTCAPEDRAQARARMDVVLSRLSAGSTELQPHPVTRETFLSNVCLSLADDCRAHVGAIYCDQWFLVVVQQVTANDQKRRIVAQCDAVEDGLAAIWEHLADHS